MCVLFSSSCSHSSLYGDRNVFICEFLSLKKRFHIVVVCFVHILKMKNPAHKGSRAEPNISKWKSKKPKFRGNRYSNGEENPKTNTSYTSASARKLNATTEFDVTVKPVDYVILSFDVFSKLSESIKCAQCDGEITFSKCSLCGLGFKLVDNCACKQKKIDSCKRVNKHYEINNRLVFAMRFLGVAHHGINLFCSLLELGNFTTYIYYNGSENMKIACKSVYDIVITKAGKEEKNLTMASGGDALKLSASGDGTWSKRGFSSLIRVTTLIGKFSGKVLDTFVSSKTCKTCETFKK